MILDTDGDHNLFTYEGVARGLCYTVNGAIKLEHSSVSSSDGITMNVQGLSTGPWTGFWHLTPNFSLSPASNDVTGFVALINGLQAATVEAKKKARASAVAWRRRRRRQAGPKTGRLVVVFDGGATVREGLSLSSQHLGVLPKFTCCDYVSMAIHKGNSTTTKDVRRFRLAPLPPALPCGGWVSDQSQLTKDGGGYTICQPIGAMVPLCDPEDPELMVSVLDTEESEALVSRYRLQLAGK